VVGWSQKRSDRYPNPSHQRESIAAVSRQAFSLGRPEDALSTRLCARRGCIVLQSMGDNKCRRSTVPSKLRHLGYLQRDPAGEGLSRR
jgi:hypothetical protein